MRLRRLQNKDAVLMLEWMHDERVVADLDTDFKKKELADCQKFIEDSQNDKENIHLAVADEMDCYMGTVSLKHIDTEEKYAEFAITMRGCAMGKGYAKYAMSEILRKAFDELQLKVVYWCVKKKNKRAIRFYDKNNYEKVENIPDEMASRYRNLSNTSLIWYAVCREEREEQ